jgi:adenylate cyclase
MPIILVTAKADSKDIVSGLEAGADEYLTKPIDQTALVARVKSVLRLKALHDQVSAQAAELLQWNQTLERRVADQVGEIERVSRLKRFLAPQIADLVMTSGDEGILQSHRRPITVLFCDLRGFTAFAETAEPEEVMALMNEYHQCLGALIHKYEGTLDRFVGDGLNVLFNDPCPVRIRRCAPCGWRWRCGVELPSYPSNGTSTGMNSGSGSGSPMVMQRSAALALRGGSTTRRSVRW